MTNPNTDCYSVIFVAYDDVKSGWLQEIFVSVCTLLSLLLGIYVFITVILKQGLHRTRLLLFYYIFTLLLLVIRLITFVVINVARFNKTDYKVCDHLFFHSIVSTVPNFLYMYGGLCQFFIVAHIVALWRLAYLQQRRS